MDWNAWSKREFAAVANRVRNNTKRGWDRWAYMWMSNQSKKRAGYQVERVHPSRRYQKATNWEYAFRRMIDAARKSVQRHERSPWDGWCSNSTRSYRIRHIMPRRSD